jgi:glycosyltransferase involved in cell wall biosynthesis
VSCRINAIMPGVTDIVSAVIPCLGEEDAIGAVVASVVAQGVAEVIVVDGASRDRTVERATAAGARVVIEPRPGLQGRDKGAELALKIRSPGCRDKMHARIPASSGLFRNEPGSSRPLRTPHFPFDTAWGRRTVTSA